MLVRLIFFAVAAICITGAAFVFEAASKTALALEMAANARASESGAVRDQLLQRAEASLRSSWAAPLDWHAGAAEAMSGILILRAEAQDDRALYAQSAAWAAHTVRLAPVQPHAWFRLALLAERGHANLICDAATCLENSWRSAAMTDPETACARLQLAHRLGLLSADDPRIDAYLRLRAPRRAVAQCLNFLTPEALFEALARDAQRRRK
jgi:hypothetical protein